MKIHNMGIQLQIVGELVITFNFYAIDMGENTHILNSKHKSFYTKGWFFKKQMKSSSFNGWSSAISNNAQHMSISIIK